MNDLGTNDVRRDAGVYDAVLPRTYHRPPAASAGRPTHVAAGDRYAAAYAAAITFAAGSFVSVVAVALLGALAALGEIHATGARGAVLIVLESLALIRAARSFREVRSPSIGR